MSRPSRSCLSFLMKTGDNDVNVAAAFPDLAINGRAEIIRGRGTRTIACYQLTIELINLQRWAFRVVHCNRFHDTSATGAHIHSAFPHRSRTSAHLHSLMVPSWRQY